MGRLTLNIHPWENIGMRSIFIFREGNMMGAMIGPNLVIGLGGGQRNGWLRAVKNADSGGLLPQDLLGGQSHCLPDLQYEASQLRRPLCRLALRQFKRRRNCDYGGLHLLILPPYDVCPESF